MIDVIKTTRLFAALVMYVCGSKSNRVPSRQIKCMGITETRIKPLCGKVVVLFDCRFPVFPHWHLFLVSTSTSWQSISVNYLCTVLYFPHGSPKTLLVLHKKCGIAVALFSKFIIGSCLCR